MTPICFRRVLSSELPQRSTILPSLNLEIGIPRILTYYWAGSFRESPCGEQIELVAVRELSSTLQARPAGARSKTEEEFPARHSHVEFSPELRRIGAAPNAFGVGSGVESRPIQSSKSRSEFRG